VRGLFFERLAATRAAASPRRWVWIPYDQLRADHPLLGAADEVGIVYVESAAKPGRRPYHKQKLALVLAAQRHHALERAQAGHRVVYHLTGGWYDAALQEVMTRHRIEAIDVMEPAEPEVREPLAGVRGVRLHPNRLFATDRAFYDEVFHGKKTRRLETFYRAARRRTGLLMDGDAPRGGRWNFDAQNRSPWPGAPPPPAPRSFPPDAITREVLDLVGRGFPKSYGSLEGFGWPVTAAQARSAADHFMEAALPAFGPYEDAMDAEQHTLFHSQLSAPLNLGLLDPLELCRQAAARLAAGGAPLASVEGFVRQILGWREFVRHVFEEHRSLFRSANALEATLPLPAWYWGKPSGMACLDNVAEQVLRTGYSHHITRLMVLANVATLLGVDPHRLNEWFWIAYVDAFEWVVTPNVIGMGSFADGGLLASKPYVCSGRYVARMGASLCQSCGFDPRAATGPGSCPLNHLYWDFMDRQRRRLRRNPRMSLVLAQLARLGQRRLREHRRTAAEWRERARGA
jgi:deoxyribodipyrimidine photolyase-related protein